MKSLFKVLWFKEDGWGRQHSEEQRFFLSEDERIVRDKLNLPGEIGYNGYSNFDKVKDKLFSVEKLNIEEL